MSKLNLMTGAVALGAWLGAAAPAVAGPCAQQIDAITNSMSANDAGSGTTSGSTPAAGASKGSMDQAQAELARARQLDQQGSSDCTSAVEAARKLMQGG